MAGGRVRTFVQSVVDVENGSSKDATAAAAIIDPTGRVVTSFGLEPAALNPADGRVGRVLGGARDLDPADYRVRVAAVLPDGRAGSLEAPLAAKTRRSGDLSYSDLMVGLRPAAGQAFRPVPEPVVDRELMMAVELGSDDPELTGATEVSFEIAEQVNGEPLVEQKVDVPQGKRVAAAAASLELTLRPGAYVARARVTARDQQPVLLARRFVVAAASGAGDVLGPRVDETKLPPPSLLAFRREHAIDTDTISPFLDHLAKAFPSGRAGSALIAKAHVRGTSRCPHRHPPAVTHSPTRS